MDKRDIEKLLGADPKTLTASLSEADRRLLQSLIADPVAREKFLSTKEAGAILSMLNRGEGNGRS